MSVPPPGLGGPGVGGGGGGGSGVGSGRNGLPGFPPGFGPRGGQGAGGMGGGASARSGEGAAFSISRTQISVLSGSMTEESFEKNTNEMRIVSVHL
jgi:hypothetical protein